MCKPIIFLLSYPRSGSTLLQTILETHPHIDSRPEDCSLSYFLKKSHNINYWKESKIKQKNNINYWLEKDVFLFKELDALKKYFPNAFYIWLTRNPIDCIGSNWILHKGKKNIEDLANSWIEFNEKVNQESCKFIVSYESFVKNPKLEIERIAKYLNLDSTYFLLDPNYFNTSIYQMCKVPHPEVIKPICIPKKNRVKEELPEKIFHELCSVLANYKS